jgi:hypothetical protein
MIGWSSRPGIRRMLVIAGVLAAVGIYVLTQSLAASSARVPLRAERHPQKTWVACNRNARNGQPSTFQPLSDRLAASLVTPQPEVRRDNAVPYTVNGVRQPAANSYVPTAAQIRAFLAAKSNYGQTNVEFNPYYKYVDGRDGMKHPSTDDLIQWAAHKWGIPEDWLRAEYVKESYWNQFMLGDDTPVPASWYRLYPSQSRVPHSSGVYQSLGITQVRWAPDGSLHPGTEPLRWLSTSFNVDYQAATVRFYYDNPQGSRTAWGDGSYVPCQAWNSIGAWYQPYPWNNAGQHGYVASVQGILSDREWTKASFTGWTPSSLPPGVKLN